MAVGTIARGLPLAPDSMPEPPDDGAEAVYVWDGLGGRFRIASDASVTSTTQLAVSHTGRFVVYGAPTASGSALVRWDRQGNRAQVLTPDGLLVDRICLSMSRDSRRVALLANDPGDPTAYAGLHVWRDPVA